ncbi:hypothetical protein A2276_04565 [candidate division WOR-1 bacterium RIFOXYA12_FULL_43_27]|uniref:V-type ATP synthase subunit C n=1 Tax=candidate division WOR-1 bacterium RIFOXYC2_FULL_46_14 TaxID=1802587 RepID=A0A1F4U5V5_UNCSA|nr:MAG: hypothetical protein A2276_04565 [candidate division WOR-1 bacterium RIFOXYA12_FULL_43_27]OGC18901.1 MAG: hypothetical protein A2292_08270 [candidate division WOR-1 bacterium RIFOXYB2_FULL_46_45]OGC29042.1 MAG: hypothetical protein A2232_03335 [candidate division WOR-1 bacterium RIFOXYA2_FULL_46_56]OGC39663.1 MAG: hypothetical protein A2438_06725 [candidate division WOR-1 bacterium RIFOXYC2_FULL_46_14]
MKTTEQYHYGVGRVRSLEARLLTSAQLERMSQAESFEAALAVLAETPYSETLTELKQAFDPEELYQLEWMKLKKLLRGLSLGHPFIAALLNKPAGSDTKLEQEYYGRLKKAGRATGSALIYNWILFRIDLINLKTLLRLREQKKEKEAFLKSMLEPGSIDRETLLGLFDKSEAELAAQLAYTNYAPDITKALASRKLDDFCVGRLKRAKYLNSGLEPLVGFYLAKESELRAIRFLLIGKKNFIGSEDLSSRIGTVY